MEEEVIKNSEVDKGDQMKIDFDNLKELGLGFNDNEIAALKKEYIKPKDETKVENTEVEKKQEVHTESKPQKEVKSDNPFLADIEEQATPKVEDNNDVLSLLKSNGINIKSIDEFPKFLDEYKSTTERVKELEAASKDGSIAIDLLNKIPDDILGLINSWANNEDYVSKMREYGSKTIDFTAPFEKQSLRSILSYYAPSSKLSDIEDDSEFEKELKDSGLYDTLKKNYAIDAKETVSIRKKIADENDAKVKKLTESANASIENISKSFPDIKFNKKHSDEVANIMTRGSAGILELFLNSDGTYKQEAAGIIAMAKYGYDAIKDLKEMLMKRAETKVTEDFISRGKKTPDSGNKEYKSTEVDMKKLDLMANEMLGIKNKTTTL